MGNDLSALRRAPLPVILAATLGLAGCGDAAPTPNAGALAEAGPSVSGPVRLTEAFLTPMDTLDDVDSPAAWRAPDGEILLLATAKGSHVVIAYDGETGALVGRMGRQGSAPGEFLRPNGIFVHDDLVYIVERDNRRVQVLTLPDFQPVATFGDDVLLKPYGITGFATGDGILHLWITDDFDVTGEGLATWENRVKRFAVEVTGSGAEAIVSANLAGTVGDADGPGRLVVVESILADPAHDRLLIADEDEAERTIKVFRLDGTFTGQQLGEGIFRAEPEGIALWGCGASGYLLMADQSHDLNQFHVFDRESLEHLGTFAGKAVANTDGVAVLTGPAGRLGEGAFYAIHADQGAVGFAWADVASALGLRPAC